VFSEITTPTSWRTRCDQRQRREGRGPRRHRRLFFPSSACVYPPRRGDPAHSQAAEALAYPAQPANNYGWEKLFAERLYAAHARAGAFELRLARFHSLFGPLGAWRGGREKAVAAICRKVAEACDGGTVDVWGDGLQTRSFLYIDEALDGVGALMRSDFEGPVNLGSDEMISIRDLAAAIIAISGKKLRIVSVDGPQGVRAIPTTVSFTRGSARPPRPLGDGLAITYSWVASQVHSQALEATPERHERTG
jgi:nucleoside-diphosphate-sugar epimerase